MPIGNGRPHTLQISWPFGRTLVESIALLIVVLGASEILARTDLATSVLLPPSISGGYEIGGKLSTLDRQVASKGQPDCIILGSSQTMQGINPDVLSQVYATKFHRALWCYNFGIDAADALVDSELAEILVREYHPRLLIFGTNYRDYDVNFMSMNIPWTNYFLGPPSLQGWLDARSYAFRYYSTYSYVVQNGTAYWLDRSTYSPSGFRPRTDTIDLADPTLFHGKLWDEGSAFSKDFRITGIMRSALKKTVNLKSDHVEVVLVEMPLPPGVYQALPNGEANREKFINMVSETTAQQHVLFWQTQDTVQIPANGWTNPFHLNVVGADAFSHWLGEQINSAIESNQMHLPD